MRRYDRIALMIVLSLLSAFLSSSPSQDAAPEIGTDAKLHVAAKGCVSMIRGESVDQALAWSLAETEAPAIVRDQASTFLADNSTQRVFGGGEGADVVVVASEAERRCQISDLSNREDASDIVRDLFSSRDGWLWEGDRAKWGNSLSASLITATDGANRITTVQMERQPPAEGGRGPAKNASWIVRPRPEYPTVGLSRDVNGWVVARCAVLDNGDLRDCSIVEEQPPEHGFGPATLTSLAGARVLVDPLEREMTDGTVLIPQHYRIAQ